MSSRNYRNVFSQVQICCLTVKIILSQNYTDMLSLKFRNVVPEGQKYFHKSITMMSQTYRNVVPEVYTKMVPQNYLYVVPEVPKCGPLEQKCCPGGAEMLSQKYNHVVPEIQKWGAGST